MNGEVLVRLCDISPPLRFRTIYLILAWVAASRSACYEGSAMQVARDLLLRCFVHQRPRQPA
jgi:hypothetical protein